MITSMDHGSIVSVCISLYCFIFSFFRIPSYLAHGPSVTKRKEITLNRLSRGVFHLFLCLLRFSWSFRLPLDNYFMFAWTRTTRFNHLIWSANACDVCAHTEHIAVSNKDRFNWYQYQYRQLTAGQVEIRPDSEISRHLHNWAQIASQHLQYDKKPYNKNPYAANKPSRATCPTAERRESIILQENDQTRNKRS